MKLIYKGETLFESEDKNKLLNEITRYKENVGNKHLRNISRANNIYKQKKFLIPKKISQTDDEYLEYLKENFPDIAEDLKYLKEEYLENSFLHYYFIDPSLGLFGWTVRDGTKEKNISPLELSFNIQKMVPYDKDFKIE